MTIKLSDLKHLELMNSLAAKKDEWLTCEKCGEKDFSKPGHIGTAKVMRCKDCCSPDDKHPRGGFARLCRKCCPSEHLTKFVEASFDENILKLSSLLRTEGFDKYASELENKFVLYKAAKVHLYRAHDEDGEDLVNAAHPDGDVNMGEASENNGDVETIVSQHKKIVDVLKKEPTGKLAFYVELCKIALGQDSSSEELLKKKFPEFAKNFLSDLNRVIVSPLSAEKYQEADLPNGKKVKDYDTNSWLSIFNMWAKLYDTGLPGFESSLARSLGHADQIIKNIYDLIEQIDKAIDAGNPVFENKQFPDIAWAALNTHREEFLSIYTAYNKDVSASQWHGQFISVDTLSNKVSGLVNKLSSISLRIDRHILSEPAFKDFAKFLSWFGGIKSYVNKLTADLNKMVSGSKTYIDEISKLHRGSQALIDANRLKQILQSENSKILEAQDINLTTNNANDFLSSLNSIYTDVLNACKNSLQNVKVDEQVKSEILKHFEI